MGWLRRLFKAEKGTIAVMGALSLASMLGMTSLAVEVGAGYAAKVRNQRVADMAALGASVAYANSSQSMTVATATANDIVVANGLPSSSATVSSVTVGTQSGIKVAVTTSVPVRIGQILGAGTSYNVSNAAVAAISSGGTTACVVVLGTSGNTVSATGGTSLTASGCAINSNGTAYSDNSSAKITAKQITAAGISDAAAAYNQNAITTTPTAGNISVRAGAASDSIKATNTQVQTALCYVNKLAGTTDSDYAGGNTSCTSPLVTAGTPTNSGSNGDWNLTYSAKSAGGYYAYQTSDYSCNYVVPVGTYNIKKLTVGGGCQISFASGSTLTFDSIDMSGQGMTIGDGNVTVVGTFGFNSGSTITIGNGTHNFGALAVTGGRTLIIGSGDLIVRGSITESGGSYIKVNTSAGNVVTINGDGAGTAINIGGGSYTCFTSACTAPTAAAGTFSANGSIITAGGSTLVLPNSMTHVINGDLNLNGSSILGAGLYVIKGNFTNNTGGTMTGANVTFALGGSFTLSGGTSLDLAAPSSSSSYGITDILVATKTTAATTIGGGSQDKYSGLFYAPYSALSMSGGSSVSNNGSQCLMLVLKSIALTGSAAITTSSCASQATSVAGTPALIQ